MDAQVLRVGICRLSSLGDVALSTVCLDLLAKLDRPVRVYWVGMPPHHEVLVHSPVELVPIVIDPRAKWRSMLSVVDELKHLHLLVDLQKNLRSWVLCKLLLWRWYVPCCSYDKERLRRWLLILAARLRGRRYDAPVQIFSSRQLQFARMRACLAAALQVAKHDARPRLRVNPAAPRHGRLGVAVGARYATKRAPPALLIKVLQHVIAVYDRQGVPLTVHVLGNAQERELGERVCAGLALPSAQVANLCGTLTLAAVPVQLASLAVLLCNDTGLLHIAEAVNTPVVALFGPTVEAFGFRPWHEGSYVFSSRIGCRPCSRHGRTPCRYGDHMCFTQLDSKAIAQALVQRLSE